MKKVAIMVAAVAVLGTLVVSSVSAQGGPPPPPSHGEVIATDLIGSIGSAVGPDGALYVAENGTGGDTEIDAPEGYGLPPDTTLFFGLTGRVSRIDPATGARSTAVGNLPSLAFGEPGQGSGPTDVAFLEGEMYVLITGSSSSAGEEEWPNGVYRVEDSDTVTLIADITEFNDDNPVSFPDALPGGNPFAIAARGDGFIVSDGNYNRLLQVSLDGEIDILASFDNVVPTGLETQNAGPLLGTWFSPAPHDPADSKVIQVGVPTGSVTGLASGYAQMIDVETGPNGKTYVLQFGDQTTSEEEPPPPGRILLLENGTLTPVVTGLFLATSLDFIGDAAFVTSLAGTVTRIDGFSSISPVTAAPTAVPPSAPAASPTARSGVVTAPDTGSGPGGSDAGMLWFGIAAVLVVGTSLAALGYRARIRG